MPGELETAVSHPVLSLNPGPLRAASVINAEPSLQQPPPACLKRDDSNTDEMTPKGL